MSTFFQDQAKKGGASFWGSAGGGKKTAKEMTIGELRNEAAELEALNEQYGARATERESPGLGMRVIDLLSRGNYAVAGAAEELFTERGQQTEESALGRFGREFFSGVGNLKGDKEGFAQVMEQSGVGTLGSLSDLAPELYSDTGEGLALERGGMFDVTGRGVAGFAMDVLLDPTTYLTAGAGKGIQFAGKSIPGSKESIRALGKASKAVIESNRLMSSAVDTLGRTFKRDWGIRNLTDAVRMKQRRLNKEAYEIAKWNERLEKSAIARVPAARRAEFIDAVEDGTAMMKYAQEPDMLKAADEWGSFMNELAESDVAAGLLDENSIVRNYVTHLYDNTMEELNLIGAEMRKHTIFRKTGPVDKATIGPFAEIRKFKTLREAEEWSKAQHALDPKFPILKPNRDPLEIISRRGQASIKGRSWDEYLREVEAKYGRVYNPQDFYDIGTPIRNLSRVDEERLVQLKYVGTSGEDAALAAAQRKNFFSDLSENGKKEFVRRQLLEAKSAKEALEVLEKYGVENAPKQISLLGKVAEDGTPYVPVDIDRLKNIEIPKSLADDLADAPESVLRDRNLQGMLRAYDRMNNTFKGAVTVLFPAFHFRNAYSNIAQGFADIGFTVLNPFLHNNAVRVIRGTDDVIKIGDQTMTAAALKDEMARNGVFQLSRDIAEYVGEPGIRQLTSKAAKATKIPRAIGESIENEARAALYLAYRRRGMGVEDAAERVNQFLFDYSNLSRVEKSFFKRNIPFYTFTRKNLERQVKNLATKPGLTATQVKPFRGREEENASLTKWEAEGLKVRLNRDGQTLRVLTGIDLPIRNLNMIWNGSMSGTARQALGQLSPLLKTGIELGAGTSLFTGKQFERTQSAAVGRFMDAVMPKSVKDWFGYSKKIDAAGRPVYEFDGERFYIFFQSWALSRLVSTTDRQFRTLTQDPDLGPLILDLMTGMRDKKLNLTEEERKMVQERIRMLQDRAVKRGVYRRFSNVYEGKDTTYE